MIRRLSRDRFLSDDELARFLTAVRERRHVHRDRDYALFVLLSTTGIRPSEALALNRSDLHLSAGSKWIRVQRLKKRRPEFDDMQIPGSVALALEHHLASLSGERLFPMHRRSAQRLFRYYARAAKLPQRFYLYCLRHTAATRIYRATRDVSVVQALLGHDSPDTSCIYAHVTQDMLREHADAFPVAL